MLYFWTLSMCHTDGVAPNSVFVNLNTLMAYWGHKLLKHEDIQCCEIKQEYISSDRLTDDNESLIEVEIYNKQEEKYNRHYFLDIKDIVRWQEFNEDNCMNVLDHGSMNVRTLHICRD